MPALANLVVKKVDGTTDITYDALSGSGGDGSPSVWRQDTGATAGKPVGLRPMFKLHTQWNGPKTARQAKFNLVFPYAVQDTTTTLWQAKDRVVFDGVVTVPQGIPFEDVEEAVFQGLNLLSALLVKQSVTTGYAPT